MYACFNQGRGSNLDTALTGIHVWQVNCICTEQNQPDSYRTLLPCEWETPTLDQAIFIELIYNL
jgi:hypothetical protein